MTTIPDAWIDAVAKALHEEEAKWPKSKSASGISFYGKLAKASITALLPLIEAREKTIDSEYLIDGANSIVATHNEIMELRNALKRIVGLCGDHTRCLCGRPTGLPAIIMCANTALEPTAPEGKP